MAFAEDAAAPTSFGSSASHGTAPRSFGSTDSSGGVVGETEAQRQWRLWFEAEWQSFEFSHEKLVSRVKRLQRTEETERRKWWQWCEAHGAGVRDPKRHTP